MFTHQKNQFQISFETACDYFILKLIFLVVRNEPCFYFTFFFHQTILKYSNGPESERYQAFNMMLC